MDLLALRGLLKPLKQEFKVWIPQCKKYKQCFEYKKEGHSRTNYKEGQAKKKATMEKKKEGKNNNY